MGYPESPYSVEGTIKIGGFLQAGMTVTIQNVTKTTSGTCTTDYLGRYLYDDIQDSSIQAEAGNSIRVCTASSGTVGSITFTAGAPEEKVVNLDYILHPHPPPPYSIEGTVIYYDIVQPNLTVTIRNLTKGTSGTCQTDSLGRYFYDDIRDGVILSEAGDSINVGTPDGATQTFTAVYSEEKVVNFINIVMWGGLWKVVITPQSGGSYTFQNNDDILSTCKITHQIHGLASFDVTILNDDGIFSSIFAVGDQVEIWIDSELGVIGSTKKLKGLIDTVEFSRSYNDNRITLKGFDYLTIFKRIVVNEIYYGKRTYDDIITNATDGLLALYAPEILGSGVQATGLSLTADETMIFSHTSLYDCINKINDACGDWVFSISPIGVLNLEPRGYTDPEKTIVEFDNTNFTYNDTNMANRVTVVGGSDRNRQSKVMWSGSASHNSLESGLAFNGSYSSGWDSGIAQTSGQWFKLDLGGLLVISEMFLNNSTYFSTKYPRSFKVEASADNINWDEITTVSQNVSPDVIVSFKKNYYRYILITLQGVDTETWAIGEINIYSENVILAQYEDAASISEHGLYHVVIKDSAIVSKGEAFARAVSEVQTRKSPVISGSISINYFFLINHNELLTVTIPETTINHKLAVQKISVSESGYGTWREQIDVQST